MTMNNTVTAKFVFWVLKLNNNSLSLKKENHKRDGGLETQCLLHVHVHAA